VAEPTEPTAGDVVRVLIVDDQVPFRAAARSVVAHLPRFVVVGEGASGTDALQLADALAPDLVLMDIQMPELDGISAARRLHDAHPDVFVVLMSSYERSDLPGDLAGSDATAYLAKEDLSPAALASIWDERRGRSGAGSTRS
jgi:DNA-binding NarL/FixJ family response regulator